jgi:hypothetical protein
MKNAASQDSSLKLDLATPGVKLIPACMITPKLFAALVLIASSMNASTRSLDGLWRSEGWGSLYEMKGMTLRSFEVTRTTCVAGFSARRIFDGTVENKSTFRSPKEGLFYIVDGADEAHASIQRAAGLISIPLTRISVLPDVCKAPTANSPLGNFEVFSRTFSEHYIAFDLRHSDWDMTVAQQRAKVTGETTPVQLFEILKAMIAPLADIHTGIEAPKIKRIFDAPLRPGTDRVVRGNINRFAKTGRRELASVTNRGYLHDPLSSLCRGQWQYGLTEGGVGYLRILQFGGYSRRDGMEHDLQELNRALDQILGNRKLRGLVIDVRLSFGGDDRLGLAIAARLTARQYTAYAIQARSDPMRRSVFTALQPVSVMPGRGPTFTGPVVELIGPITMSAAETFTQALMERTPHITRIGENTQGVFCDSLERHLPNGWSFELPNAIYRTSDNKAFDVSGIPPDVAVPVFADEDLANGRDPAMAAAMRLLLTGE